MSEEKIVEIMNEALVSAGIDDTVIAAGEFNPRGHSGAGFAGGLLGGDIGDVIGSPSPPPPSPPPPPSHSTPTPHHLPHLPSSPP